jgi:hypothetical protein
VSSLFTTVSTLKGLGGVGGLVVGAGMDVGIATSVDGTGGGVGDEGSGGSSMLHEGLSDLLYNPSVRALGFHQIFALEDAIGSHDCWLGAA